MSKTTTVTLDKKGAATIRETADVLKAQDDASPSAPEEKWRRVQIAERHLRGAEDNLADVQNELKTAKARVEQAWAKLREASRGEDDMPLFQGQKVNDDH